MLLEEKHQETAKEIILRNRKKKSCNKCYDRGFIGFTADKTIIPCEKCVDIEKAMEEWKAYVAADEALKDQFSELFEEENVDTETEPDSSEEKTENEETEQPVEEKKLSSPKAKEDISEKPKLTRNPKTTQTKTASPKNTTQTTKSSPVRKTSGRGK